MMSATVTRVLRSIVLLGALVAASVLPQTPAIPRGDTPDSCLAPNRHMTLYAVELDPTPEGDLRLGYGLSPETAQIPGPTIEMIEGECLAVTLVNLVSEDTLNELRFSSLGSKDPEMPLGVSLHVHGVKYTTGSDGTLHTNSWVPPNQSYTYTWYAAPRLVVAGRLLSQGTAGTWWYHDHVVGTDHGTGGIGTGLFGALIVRRATDIRPDRTYTIAMGNDATLNLRTWPDTDCPDGVPSLEHASNTCVVALLGERVEFAVLGIGDDFHTFHLHAHTWADNRTGILESQLDETRLIDNKTVGPADTFGFQVIAGEESGPGPWMLHCHVQRHSDRGMFTFFHVLNSDGTPASSARLDPHQHFGQ